MHGHLPSTSSADLLHRIRAEFNEMPGLRVTFRQAQRLWGLEEKTCLNALAELVASGFLTQTPGGLYGRASAGPSTRAVKAHLIDDAARRRA